MYIFVVITIWENELQEKISSRKATIGIIGMGYVGSALAESIITKGYFVIGFEKNSKRREIINNRKNEKLIATDEMSKLNTCDIIIICVQTPIHEDKTPNLDYLISATEELEKYLRRGQLITIESSINPGITRNIVAPLFAKSRLELGKDFFLAFSPERINPGDSNFSLEQIPKVVSGYDQASLELVALFYNNIFQSVIPVSTLETAEMVKIFENTFRFVNISLVNELQEYTKNIGVDMWEVIRAAATKPFGFLPHFPGPGVGGHCIPVDPYYLFEDAKKKNISMSILKAAGDVNDQQPYKVVEETLKILQIIDTKKVYQNLSKENEDMLLHTPISLQEYPPLDTANKTTPMVGIKGGTQMSHTNGVKKKTYKIMLIGITYKPDIDDVRESPALKIWELFESLGHSVSYHDPYVPTVQDKSSTDLSEDILRQQDIIIVITNHKNIDYSLLLRIGVPIVDTRHVYTQKLSHIYYV